MKFKDILNQYIEELGCTAQDISDASGLSPATVSRYRSGERTPEARSKNLSDLIGGIADIATQKNISGVTSLSISKRFFDAADIQSIDGESFRIKFNLLCNALNVSISDFARSMNYDPSYISRIRNGHRRPSDPQKFASETVRYITRTHRRSQDHDIIANIIGCDASTLSEGSAYTDLLFNWLANGSPAPKNELEDYLKKLDEFDLNEYIKAIHFDTLKIPTAHFQFPTFKYACDLNQMMDIELDFIKATVLSKSMEDVINYSDMPIEEMSKDKEFPKKWMYGMALMLKKGLHINMIHDINRPFSEMMLGLESWIPLYMTGQISPYYINTAQNSVFLHFLKVSGTAALTGEAISGYQKEGRYYLTKKENEVAYYKKRAERLLSKALPLMTIYDMKSASAYRAFMKDDARTPGNRRRLGAALSLFTAPDELISQIMEHNHLPKNEQEIILNHISDERCRIEQIMSHDKFTEEISFLDENEFRKTPVTLSLSAAFYEIDVYYTYDEYLKHLDYSKAYADAHDNYELKLLPEPVFTNIQITLHEGKWAVVSKGKSPCIHFMIFHPKMRSAIENMVVPIIEE